MIWVLIVPLAVAAGVALAWTLVELGVKEEHVKLAAAAGGGVVGVILYWWLS